VDIHISPSTGNVMICYIAISQIALGLVNGFQGSGFCVLGGAKNIFYSVAQHVDFKTEAPFTFLSII
jgi:hypothetical protein